MRYKLGEIATVTKLAGFEFTKYMKYIPDGEIIAIRALNLKNGTLVLEDVRRIARDVSESLERSRLYKNDIVLSYTGTVGECAQITENGKYHLAPNVCKITPKAEVVDPIFLFQYVRSSLFKQVMLNYCHGSTQPTIPMTTIRELPVEIEFDTVQQRKVADIISCIDDKIALNQQINKNLEEQAQAIFDSFYKKAAETVSFTSLIQVLGGGTPKTGNETFWNGEIPFFTPKDVGNPYTIITEKYITPAGLEHCNSRLFPVNTTFVTARGTVGKVSLAGVPMAMNQSCYALVSDELHPILTYFYTLKTIQSLRHKASGAVFDAITTADFKTETLHKISGEASAKVLSVIEPMMENVLQNSMENIKLAQMRDTLLPRLMSGEIDVSKIEV